MPEEKLTKKTIKRFTKKELISLFKKHDFGVSTKGLTKLKKSELIDKMMKSPNFKCVVKVIKVKPKRKRSEKQKVAFKKMLKKSLEDTIHDIKNQKLPPTPIKKLLKSNQELQKKLLTEKKKKEIKSLQPLTEAVLEQTIPSGINKKADDRINENIIQDLQRFRQSVEIGEKREMSFKEKRILEMMLVDIIFNKQVLTLDEINKIEVRLNLEPSQDITETNIHKNKKLQQFLFNELTTIHPSGFDGSFADLINGLISILKEYAN